MLPAGGEAPTGVGEMPLALVPAAGWEEDAMAWGRAFSARIGAVWEGKTAV